LEVPIPSARLCGEMVRVREFLAVFLGFFSIEFAEAV
jgi:hypothetical protein